MTREGIFFFRSFYEVGQRMSMKDRLLFYDAVLRYAFDGLIPGHLKGYPEIAFISARPILDADRQKYENGQKAAGFGKLGGRPKKAQQNPGGFSENNPGGFENEKGSENPLYNKNKKQEQELKKESIEKKGAEAPAPQRMARPTLEEVAAYAAAKHYTGFNAERFYAYYESNGWKVGRNPMKSWKNAVTSWHFRDQEKNKPSADYISRTYIPDPSIYENIQSTI